MNPYAPVPYREPVGAPVEANIVSVPSNYTFVVDNHRPGNSEPQYGYPVPGTAPAVSRASQLQQMTASGAPYNPTVDNSTQIMQNRRLQFQPNNVQQGGNLKYSYEVPVHHPLGPLEVKEPKAKSLVSMQARGVVGSSSEGTYQQQHMFGTQHKRKRDVYEPAGDYQGTQRRSSDVFRL